MYNSNSPIRTTTITNPPALDMDIGNQLNVHKKEEQETHQAPDIQPFTLDSMREDIFKIFSLLMDLRTRIERTKYEPKQNSKSLDKVIKIIDKLIQDLLFSIPECLDKQKL